MQRMTVSKLYGLNSSSLKTSIWRSRTLGLTLLISGLVVWRALEAGSVSQFFVSTLLWLIGLAFAYWTIVIWDIVFSMSFDWKQPDEP